MDSPKTIMDETFLVSEIFFSIQGEGTRQGRPCVFVRLQGCNYNCKWCDTEYAIDQKRGGSKMTAKDIFEKLNSFNCNFIEFTGGEPLLQTAIVPFMKHLCDLGFEVGVETNGNIDTCNVDKRVVKIIDFKAPSSGMTKKNNFDNIEHLTSNDEVKFVLSDRKDFNWAKDLIEKNQLINKCASVLLSPVLGKLKPYDLAKWILESNLDVRMQLQLHKYIWDPQERGV